MDTIRVGVIGFGANTRLRHAPGLLACPKVTLEAVCKRSLESAQKAAQEYNIAKVYESWQAIVEYSMIDAICIGTWPSLHCPITLAALENGNMCSLKLVWQWTTMKPAKCMLLASNILNS